MSPKSDPTQSDSKADLAAMVKEPVEVKVQGEGEADVEKSGQRLDGVNVDVTAGGGAEVEIAIQGDLAEAKTGSTFRPPPLLKYVLNVYVVGLILLLPVLAGALYLLRGDSWLFMPLLIADVGLLVIVMVALCRWAILYYKHICATLGHKEGLEVVSSVAGGLSEAFPAAIIALGIGGTAAYLENQFNAAQLEQDQGNHQHEMLIAETSHLNEMALAAQQWNREQLRGLLEGLTSEGYGSLYMLKCAKERILYLQSVDLNGGVDLTAGFGPGGIKKQLVTQQYDEYAEKYSTTKSIESIVSGIAAHFNAGRDLQEGAADQLRTKADLTEFLGSSRGSDELLQDVIIARAELIMLIIGDIERYRLPQSITSENVESTDLYAGLYRLTNQCGEQIGLLRDEIQRYASKEFR